MACLTLQLCQSCKSKYVVVEVFLCFLYMLIMSPLHFQNSQKELLRKALLYILFKFCLFYIALPPRNPGVVHCFFPPCEVDEAERE